MRKASDGPRFGLAARVSRRALVAVLSLIPISKSLADDQSGFADWVRALYEGELALREAGASLSDQELQALFSPEVQKLRDAARDRVPPASEPQGPILDLLFGWGAQPNRPIALLDVKPSGDKSAVIDLTIAGNAGTLTLTGRFDPLMKSWQIDDIDYGAGGPDRTLRGRLRRMASWAKRVPS